MVNSLIKGYERYYNTVTKIGYINKNSLDTIIIANWIYDVLNGKYDVLVDEEQYNLLNEWYNCLEGNCLVPYQQYCKDFGVNVGPNNVYVKMTELTTYNTERLLEDNNLQMV